MSGADSPFTRHMPWIRAHLTHGRNLQSFDAKDFPFPDHVLDWIHAAGLFTPADHERLSAYAIPLLASIWLQHEDPHLIELCLYTMVWESAIDDAVFETGRGDEHYARSFAGILRAGRLPANPDRFHRALADIRDLYLSRGAGAVLPLLDDSLQIWFTAVVREQQWRAAGVVPDVTDYLLNRQASVGCDPPHQLIRLKYGVLGPDHPVPPDVHRLRWLASQLIGVENDLYSAHKEARDGTATTLIGVLRHQYGVDIPTAITAGFAISAALRGQHDQLLASILADPVLTPESRRYAQILGTVVDGQLEWSFAAPRYGVLDFSTEGVDLRVPPR